MEIIDFKLHEDLKQFTDSMLFDSNTDIATMQYKGESGDIVTVTLCVCGAVRVIYDGSCYKKPSEYPQALKDLIKSNREWDCAENVEVAENNWFEFIYDVDGDTDGVVCEDDISEFTEDQLKTKMLGICKWALEEDEDE